MGEASAVGLPGASRDHPTTIVGTRQPDGSNSAVVANLFLLLGIQRLSSNHREAFWIEVASPSVTGLWIARRLQIG